MIQKLISKTFNMRNHRTLIFVLQTSQWETVFFSCVPPCPIQCHRNELTCAHGPSALRKREISSKLTLIGAWGTRINMKVN